MIENPVKRLWAESKPAVKGWLSIGNGFTAEIMASAGYDAVTADLQHGAFDCHAMLGMLQAVRASGAAPMARVPWLDAGAVMKALDANAYGVICPMVNSRADAERLVSYVRCPPGGTRSFGPTRANFSAGPNYGEEADGDVICLAMIEIRNAFERVEEIAATPGLDGLYIGPADLTLGLRGAPPHPRRGARGRHPRLPAQRLRGLRGEDDRLGLRPRHRVERRPPARGRGGGQRCQGAPARRRSPGRPRPGPGPGGNRKLLAVPHVLVAGRIHEAGIEVLRSAPGVAFEVVEEVSTDAYAPRIPAADALLIRTQPLPASIVARAPKLRIVSRHGVGYDSVDVQALDARGIPLAVIGDANSRSVAEHAFTLVLALAKRVPAHDPGAGSGTLCPRQPADHQGERRGLLLLGLPVLNASPVPGLPPSHVPSTSNPSGNTAAS